MFMNIMKTSIKYKHDIKIADERFYKRLLQIKAKHGFSSLEAMLKGMEKVYKIHLKELRCLGRK